MDKVCCVCGATMYNFRDKQYCRDCEKLERRRKYLVRKGKGGGKFGSVHVLGALSYLEERELIDIEDKYKRFTELGRYIPWHWKR